MRGLYLSLVDKVHIILRAGGGLGRLQIAYISTARPNFAGPRPMGWSLGAWHQHSRAILQLCANQARSLTILSEQVFIPVSQGGFLYLAHLIAG